MLSILLLGSPQLIIQAHPVTKLRRKNRALLYYVAGYGESLTRDHILSFFWPDHDRAAAQQILRTMLYDLRQNLSTSLMFEDDYLALAPDTYVDVRAFGAMLTAPPVEIDALPQALDLYRGDFLNDFTVPDCPQFNDWAAAERERYRLLAVRGFFTLSQHCEAKHDYHTALDALNRALSFDPLQEELQRAAIRLHYLMGDRAAAIRRYDALCKLLDEEMGVPPMAATRAMYDSILNDTLPLPEPELPLIASTPATSNRITLHNVGSPAPFLPFVGRSVELKTLETMAEAYHLIVIEGEPGIGKTRLAEEFIKARANPTLILRGTAHELEQALPYQPIVEMLRTLIASPEWATLRAGVDLAPSWWAEIGRLIPELIVPGTAASGNLIDESRLWEGITQFLITLSRQCPVILLLNDLHWADTATLSLLGYLVRRAASAPLLLLCTTRPPASRSTLATLLQSLTHERRLAEVSLLSLSAADTIALAQHFSPDYSYPLSNWLMRNAEGNPYFLTELMRYAFDNQLLLPDGMLNTDALSTMLVLPQTIQNLVSSRLLHLSDNARRVLDIAAVVGQEFDAEVVIHAAQLPEEAVLTALDELQAAGLILPYKGLHFTFDHTLTMEVAYRTMGEVRYRLLHRRVAETLETMYHNRLDVVAGLLASHFTKGNLPKRAAFYAFRAGLLATKVAAWTEAIALYEQALASDIEDQLRAAVLRALGHTYIQNGLFAKASDTLLSSVRLAHELNDLVMLETAHLALNQSLYPQARYQEAIRLAQDLRQSGPPALAATAEFMWGTALALESRFPAEAADHLREAERLLNQREAYQRVLNVAMVKYQQAGVFGQQGEFIQAVALYREALALEEQYPGSLDLQRHILLYNNLGYYLHLLNDPQAADYAHAGLILAQQKGSLSHQPYLFSTLGEIALAADDLDTAEQHFTEGLALAQRLNIPERLAGLTANLGLVARRRGDTGLAIERLSRAQEQADSMGAGHLTARIRIWLAPLLPPERGLALLHEARAIAESGGYRSLLDQITRLEQQLSQS